CEPRVDLEHYHRSKTGALFVAATCSGAAAAGVEPEPWQELGDSIGEAYQVADDIQDAVADPEVIGKPTGIDVALDRPSAVRELGLDGAVKRLERCIEKGLDSIPPCKGRDLLREVVQQQSNRFFPQGVKHSAA
ncbi:MAG: polyprenyl synthetase family protein, partial [Luminiphilus sp.]